MRLPRPSSTFDFMELLLCTIGFAGKTAEEFFHLLEEAQVEKLIDIRLNRGGQLSGFAKHPDLEYFLKKLRALAISMSRSSHQLLSCSIPIAKPKTGQPTTWIPGFDERARNPQALDVAAWSPRAALLCSDVARNVTAGLSLICSQRIGGDRATALRFAISSQPPQNLRKCAG